MMVSFLWYGQMHSKEKGKKGKDCNISSTTQTHSELKRSKKNKKEVIFNRNDGKIPNHFSHTQCYAHNFPFYSLLILLCIYFFSSDVQNERREKNTNVVLQSCVLNCFFSQDFTLLFASLFFLAVSIQNTHRENERQIEELSSLFYLKEKFPSNYISLECCIQSLVAGILDRFFLQTFHFILVLFLLLHHSVSYCFPKLYACVCVMCVKYVNNIQNKNKPKRWNLFWSR